MKVLSVDWDFFINCDGVQFVDDQMEYRGHTWDKIRETLDSAGKSLQDAYPFLGPPASDFVEHFDFSKSRYLTVEESHISLFFLLQPEHNLEILNVDAHHDIVYDSMDLQDFEKQRVPTCGNWGGHLIFNSKVKSWTQVYPDWRDSFPETSPERFAEIQVWGKLKSTTITKCSLSSIKKYKPDIVFVCRSSPWVPPIYDEAFSRFCDVIIKKGKFVVPTGERFRFPRYSSGHSLFEPVG